MLRLCSRAAGLLFACLLLGCSGDRSTGNTDHSTVPTANLSDSLVIAVSAPVSAAGHRNEPGFEAHVVLPHSLLDEFGPEAEITVRHFQRSDCMSDSLDVYDNIAGDWIALGDPSTSAVCFDFPKSYDRLLSSWIVNPVDRLVDSTRTIRMRGNFDTVQIRLARVLPNYRPRRLHPNASIQDLLWTGSDIVTNLGFPISPNILFHFDQSGTQTDSLVLEGGDSPKILWSGSGFWMINAFTQEMGPLGTDGTLTQSIALRKPEGYTSRYTTLDWHRAVFRDGHFWAFATKENAPPGARCLLLGFNVAASMDSGYTVLTDSLIIPERLVFSYDMQWSGTKFHMLTYDGLLCTLSFDGQTLDSLPLPLQAEAMAWDGEAYWIAHHGTPELPSTDILLSRFYPR